MACGWKTINQHMMVNQLLNDDGLSWNKELVKAVSNDIEANQIHAIPLSRSLAEDLRI
ncbi:conserved hypothetical protein [Ricinus communis]|uniref:Uncharacterized protein n=1 Tax=Ricinus communis TaxID=3988 RepID=B9SW30_RICCO|nr:conserved hypothetical protein [Ricinus communis]